CQPAPPLLPFSTLLDPSSRLCLRWEREEQELTRSELQIHTTAWLAFGFSPRGESPGSAVATGGVFPDGSVCFSAS
ncbi:MOXD2 protein, partial [Ptilonorhynchus violaceus]|nr:MOXD2 protein [Ptilonorhynchus violaceus]